MDTTTKLCFLQLEQYLNGEITYFAYEHVDTFRILVLSEDDLSALTLTVANGRMEWNLNRYRDGSEGNTTVVPCTSEEDALAKVRRMISERFSKVPSEAILTAAEKFGVPVPEEYQTVLSKRRAATREAEKKELTARLRVLEMEETRFFTPMPPAEK